MPKEYRPPQTREEALERVEQVRRLLDERTKTVGESGTSQDMVSLQVLRDVMTSYDYLINNAA